MNEKQHPEYTMTYVFQRDKVILLRFVDEEAVREVKAEGKQVTEDKIETKPEKLPGVLVI